jgi:isopentenyl phosphate kinase
VIERLAVEISEALHGSAGFQMVIGHGSGSYGHPTADRYQTRDGAHNPAQWQGFAEVWSVANQLNRIVIDSFTNAGLSVISLPPSASTISDRGEIVNMMVEPIQRTIEAGLIPVVQGGATILSTEKVFGYLTPHLQPTTILLAGIEPGVYQDFSKKKRILTEITDLDLDRFGIGAATDVDVTGGMIDKVREALDISKSAPDCTVRIFSGNEPGSLGEALLGAPVGTLVRYSSK